MKILVVQDWLRSGGTERQSILLANAFAAAGHATTLLTFRPGGRLAATVAASVTRRALQPFDTRLDWLAPGLVGAARAGAPDVILCMGRMANCHAGALQRGNPGAAVIATMRTGKPLPWLFRRSLRRVRHVVANSRDARDLLVARHAVPTDRISVIHNSLVFPPDEPPAAVAAAREAMRAKYGAGPATTVLLCVAMFRPEKNQRELIEIVAGLGSTDANAPSSGPVEPSGGPPQMSVPTTAALPSTSVPATAVSPGSPSASGSTGAAGADRIPDWQLWLAGDGPARGACEALAATHGLGGRVKFVGFHPDPSALYAAADVAVHASWSESLSNFLIEAQGRGLAAIAYAAQGIRECFIPNRTGWAIARDDRRAFRDRLLALMSEDPAIRAGRGAEARAYARAAFDPARQVAAYLELFEHL